MLCCLVFCVLKRNILNSNVMFDFTKFLIGLKEKLEEAAEDVTFRSLLEFLTVCIVILNNFFLKFIKLPQIKTTKHFALLYFYNYIIMFYILICYLFYSIVPPCFVLNTIPNLLVHQLSTNLEIDRLYKSTRS